MDKDFIPWGYFDVDSGHYYPPEEYQISRTEVNLSTGDEEVLHYTHGDHDLIDYRDDYYNTYPYHI